jgi:small-conductance mechanosensitive channel
MKDVLSNFVSGLLLLIMRPFEIGDQIIVGPTEGVVERIELRATRMLTYDGRVVLVPNAELFTSRVTNNTAAPIRRDSVLINLDYDADLPAAMSATLGATRATEGVLEEPPPSILVRDLGATAVVLELRFWTDSRRADFLATRSRVNTAVVAALRAADVALPEPGATTTVVVSSE